MLSSLSPQVQQRLAVLVPIIALVVSLFVVYPGWNNWRDLVRKAEEKRAKLQTLKNTPIPMAAAKQPAAADTPSEPPEFLASVREVAARAGCSVVGFDLTLPPAPATGEKELALGGNPDPAKEAAEKAKKSLVKPVRGKIEIEADYQHIREFLQGIQNAPRLYAIAGVDITSTNVETTGLLRATVEIERYVLNPEASAPIGPAP